MGFYVCTYLCSGRFTSKEIVVIDKKIQIASMDSIIEQHEWTEGFVKKSDLITFLSGRNIDIIDSDTSDLFLEEGCTSTLFMPTPTSGSSKYILVERNCSYTKN